MNLIELRKKLIEQNIKPLRNPKEVEEVKPIECKIIGITGSVGKSSTAFILHSYLKSIGLRSILYSSIVVDSKYSIINGSSKDVPILNKSELLTIVNEAIMYDAQYLILEINEATIEKGIIDDVIFDVKLLTNINPRHNLEQYSEEEYVNLKKSFFNDENSQHIYCYTGYEKRILEELLLINNKNLVVSTNYVIDKYNIREDIIGCKLNELYNEYDGLRIEFELFKEKYALKTNLHFNYNAFNILNVVSILECLKIYNNESFNKSLQNIEIPGRSILLNKNGRSIIIDQSLIGLDNHIRDGQKIKVVTGFVGSGYKGFDERYKTKEYIEKLIVSHIETAKMLNEIASFVYYTSQDEGKLSLDELYKNVLPYFDNEKTMLIKNRIRALDYALMNLEAGETLYISGMGNKKTMCITENEMVYFDEIEYVKKRLKEMEWEK